ncbi:hypothetical protein N183_30570 [Sinorhizobium sp. Sb3]|nr:hypothetical protein N183_30570 [Sinorhizobium sp. Sb3]
MVVAEIWKTENDLLQDLPDPDFAGIVDIDNQAQGSEGVRQLRGVRMRIDIPVRRCACQFPLVA